MPGGGMAGGWPGKPSDRPESRRRRPHETPAEDAERERVRAIWPAPAAARSSSAPSRDAVRRLSNGRQTDSDLRRRGRSDRSAERLDHRRRGMGRASHHRPGSDLGRRDLLLDSRRRAGGAGRGGDGRRGAVAYWQPGSALCPFWGPTPMSRGPRSGRERGQRHRRHRRRPDRLAAAPGGAEIVVERQ